MSYVSDALACFGSAAKTLGPRVPSAGKTFQFSIFNFQFSIFNLVLALVLASGAGRAPSAAGSSVGEVIGQVQPKIVKIYGAGGFRGMEGYQSGVLISSEGHILTVFSYVLDTDYITATLNDGQKFEAKLVGADPRLEVAVLKIDSTDLPHFILEQAELAQGGDRVLAFSNLFGVATGNESASVQHGIVSVKTTLAARRGVFETPYRGPVYVLDVMTNNPGAAGGALVTRRGRLVAMLGKELRNALTNTWLNYAVPIEELRPSVAVIREGKFAPESDKEPEKPQRALTLRMLGIVLIPDVLQRTPPYVEQVRSGSPADEAGIRPDDLILLLDDRLVQSSKSLRADLEYIDFEDPIRLTVLREQELLNVNLQVLLEDEPELP
jgi:serine protease Do